MRPVVRAGCVRWWAAPSSRRCFSSLENPPGRAAAPGANLTGDGHRHGLHRAVGLPAARRAPRAGGPKVLAADARDTSADLGRDLVCQSGSALDNAAPPPAHAFQSLGCIAMSDPRCERLGDVRAALAVWRSKMALALRGRTDSSSTARCGRRCPRDSTDHHNETLRAVSERRTGRCAAVAVVAVSRTRHFASRACARPHADFTTPLAAQPDTD